MKLIAIVGPTSSGKSDLAVFLAKKFNGEVISADSRQVYKGFNLSSGKITKKEMAGIPHHMLDVASPKRTFTVSKFKEKAEKVLDEIIANGRVPIIAGGTGMYIDALIYDIDFPEVKPNTALRKKLSKKTPVELLSILKKLDPKRARSIEQKNPRRLIRAIEIAKELGKVPKIKQKPAYEVLWIGLEPDPNRLAGKIRDRLLARIQEGMIREIKNLHENEGLSWKRLENFGLEYRYISLYLQGKIGKGEMIELLETKIWQYAKRQMTWFKKNKKINWIKPSDKKTALSLSKKFLS